MPKFYRLVNNKQLYRAFQFSQVNSYVTLKRWGAADLVVLWPMKLISSTTSSAAGGAGVEVMNSGEINVSVEA
jgi:hypothetical protein